MSKSPATSRNDAERALQERSQALRRDIQRELVKADAEHYEELAGRVSDSGEKAVADLLVDLDLAEITRDVEELREVEGALLRIARGTWGYCVDCGGEIEPDRLAVLPSAARCLRCQQHAENPAREEQHRTL
ncbi:TraR/DksA family transcriptional regulator [Lentisalinibacter sediminis]|uniref:TraR/DksA family transcriptional regulator n=1 Tax=Lentisalinibacter sediminis TaxID=2992237 RepID=UPI00386B24BF